MKKMVLIGALVATVAATPGWAQGKGGGNCYSPAAIEAEEAIRYITDLMVVSSVCRDTVYAEFRLRNQDAIKAYQKALIAHFRGNAAFDKWNTSLANQSAQKQAGENSRELCQQSVPLLRQASTLDMKGFRAYAATQAASAGTRYAKCGPKKG